MAVEAQQQGILLTELEKRIFDRLLGAVDRYCPGTQLRVAGGWVRDKLLGEASNDIDIALDNNRTGQDFCRQVNKYLEWIGEEQKTVGVSKCNPDKSKHLETATMSICDMKIDFVNLRSEKYAENSRIPTVENCSAEDDALRRDLTINSLFYNINTKSVEDFTRRGCEDLKNGLIATPSSAKSTFLDDPLWVLRAIRFAARFSFTLAEDLKKAASDEDVKSGLCSKISRERIGREVDRMMSGKDPVNAMCYIRDLGLFYVVFEFPGKQDPPVLHKHDWLCVSHIEAAWSLAQLIGYSVFRDGSDSNSLLCDTNKKLMVSMDEKKRLCLYSALFTPVRNIVYIDKSEKIINVHAASEKFAELILVLESNENLESVREKLKLNDEYLEIPTDMVKRVFAGLQNVWDMKPQLNGHDIRRVLQIPECPLVGKWIQRVLKWQFAHPQGTKEECEEWMKKSLLPKRQKVEM
ncbi:hypothetical protein ACQ4PT_068611 [Festuca glaucescens]